MRNLLPLCLIQKLSQPWIGSISCSTHGQNTSTPLSLQGCPLVRPSLAHLDSGTHYQVTRPTLIECLSHSGLALTAQVNDLCGCPPPPAHALKYCPGLPPLCRSLSLPSLASHSPHTELTLGRFPAPILGCQPCSKSLACLPLSRSCVDVYFVWYHLLSWP